jgi:hypothetical protein
MRWGSIWLYVAALAAGGAGVSGCSSQALPDAHGGSSGSMSSAGGYAPGMGGASTGGRGAGGSGMVGAGMGGTGMGGNGMGGTDAGGTGSGGFVGVTSNGSCIPNHINPDTVAGGACAADCQSVSCGRPCTEDCCVTCGIDASGTKTCVCPMPGQPYSNCICAPPMDFPPGLAGGPCSPQGYAATVPPPTAPAGAISIKGAPCRALNIVCFTAESTPAAERGCICLADGTMHCGSVNHWFLNTGAPTQWMP